MAALVLAMTLREQFTIVGIHLIYAAIFFVLISNPRHNSISLTAFFFEGADNYLAPATPQRRPIFHRMRKKSALNSQFRTPRQIKLRAG